MASARRVGTNEQISSYGVSGVDYTSLSTWESATDRNLASEEVSEVLECEAETYTDSIALNGATTSSSFFRIIRPNSASKHGGLANAGVRFTTTADAAGCRVVEPNFSLQDVAWRLDINSSSNRGTVIFAAGSGGGDAVGVIAHDSVNAGSGVTRGISQDGDAGSQVAFIDCLAYGVDSIGFRISSSAGYNVLLYNCTAARNANFGVNAFSGSVIAKNCLSRGNVNNDFNEQSGTFVSGTVTNASEDGTAPGIGSRINQTFTFVDAGADHYKLDPADEGALDFGTDLSADAAFPFNDDIVGEPWNTWDIGCFSVDSASGSVGSTDETLDPLASIASGELVLAGSATPTLAALTSSAIGDLALVGSTTRALDAATLQASGTSGEPITGSSSQTLDALTSTGAGELALVGNATPTLGVLTSAASGELALSGSSTPTLDALASTATGGLAITGSASTTLDPIALEASGISGAVTTGSTNETLGFLTSAAFGEVALAGVATPTLAALTSSATGEVAITGSSTRTLGGLTSAVSGKLDFVGGTSTTLAAVTLQASGISGEFTTGSTDQTLAALTGVGAGELAISGSSGQTLAPLASVATATLALIGNVAATLEAVTLISLPPGAGPAFTSFESLKAKLGDWLGADINRLPEQARGYALNRLCWLIPKCS